MPKCYCPSRSCRAIVSVLELYLRVQHSCAGKTFVSSAQPICPLFRNNVLHRYVCCGNCRYRSISQGFTAETNIKTLTAHLQLHFSMTCRLGRNGTNLANRIACRCPQRHSARSSRMSRPEYVGIQTRRCVGEWEQVIRRLCLTQAGFHVAESSGPHRLLHNEDQTISTSSS
jgi:hypothetical protein